MVELLPIGIYFVSEMKRQSVVELNQEHGKKISFPPCEVFFS